VVAAEKNMVANCETRELEVAIFFSNRDQREVRRAAADIDDENHVADFHLLAKPVADFFQPRIKGSLRLFEQRYVVKARKACSLHCEFSRGGIKRCRNGENDVFGIQIRFLRGVPRSREMLQISLRSFTR